LKAKKLKNSFHNYTKELHSPERIKEREQGNKHTTQGKREGTESPILYITFL